MKKLFQKLFGKKQPPKDIPTLLAEWSQNTADQLDRLSEILSTFDTGTDDEYVKKLLENKRLEVEQMTTKFLFSVTSLRDFSCTLYGWYRNPPRPPSQSKIRPSEDLPLAAEDEIFLNKLEQLKER